MSHRGLLRCRLPWHHLLSGAGRPAVKIPWGTPNPRGRRVGRALMQHAMLLARRVPAAAAGAVGAGPTSPHPRASNKCMLWAARGHGSGSGGGGGGHGLEPRGAAHCSALQHSPRRRSWPLHLASGQGVPQAGGSRQASPARARAFCPRGTTALDLSACVLCCWGLHQEAGCPRQVAKQASPARDCCPAAPS